MIRINLAKISSVDSGGEGFSAGGLNFGDSSLASKVAIIFAIPIILYFWEQNQIGSQKDLLGQKNIELAKAKQVVADFGSVSTVVQGVKAEKEKLKNRLEIIKKISGNRALKLKTLSELQILLPEDCWINKIEFKGMQILIAGFARSPSSVQNLAEKLESLDYIATAIPENLKRATVGEGKIHSFDIKAEARIL